MDARGGFPQTTIFRAAESLGIVKKDGYWSLPEGTDDGPEVQAP